MNHSTTAYRVTDTLGRYPFLVHGFGMRALKDKDFDSIPDLAGFRRVSLRQTHSDVVRVINKLPFRRMEGDALVTDRRGILLIIKTADCLPVLVVDPLKRVVAAVHCGWKGTLKRVIVKTLRSIEQAFGSDLTSLSVALGPCIGRSCYEVGKDVKDKFESKGLRSGDFESHPSREDKYLFDLRGANRSQILEMGVPEDQIFSDDACTHCEEDLLSYRRDRDHAGRLINFIGLC